MQVTALWSNNGANAQSDADILFCDSDFFLVSLHALVISTRKLRHRHHGLQRTHFRRKCCDCGHFVHGHCGFMLHSSALDAPTHFKASWY